VEEGRLAKEEGRGSALWGEGDGGGQHPRKTPCRSKHHGQTSIGGEVDAVSRRKSRFIAREVFLAAAS